MAIAIDVAKLRERPREFLPKLSGPESVDAVEVLQAHHERAVLKLTKALGLTRFLKLDSNEARHRHEVAGLEVLAELAMAPDIVFCEPNAEGLSALVMAEAHGQSLSASSSQAHWTAVGRHLVKLNAIDVNTTQDEPDDDWPTYLAGLAGYADGSDTVTNALEGSAQSIADEIVGLLPSSDKLGFVHGDAQPGHFFVDRGRTQAIDLADWTSGDIAFDLAVLTLDETDRLDDLLLEFNTADRESTATRVWLYRRLRLATEIRWFDEHDFDPTPLVARLSAMMPIGDQGR